MIKINYIFIFFLFYLITSWVQASDLVEVDAEAAEELEKQQILSTYNEDWIYLLHQTIIQYVNDDYKREDDYYLMATFQTNLFLAIDKKIEEAFTEKYDKIKSDGTKRKDSELGTIKSDLLSKGVELANSLKDYLQIFLNEGIEIPSSITPGSKETDYETVTNHVAAADAFDFRPHSSLRSERKLNYTLVYFSESEKTIECEKAIRESGEPKYPTFSFPDVLNQAFAARHGIHHNNNPEKETFFFYCTKKGNDSRSSKLQQEDFDALLVVTIVTNQSHAIEEKPKFSYLQFFQRRGLIYKRLHLKNIHDLEIHIKREHIEEIGLL